MTPGDGKKYPEHATDAASMSVIARFAMAQEEIDTALDAYLDAALSPEVKQVVWRRVRLSDAERLKALMALARTAGYPLHEDAYRETFRSTMAVRNVLAHGGLGMALNNASTGEPGMLTFGRDEQNVRFYSLSELKTAANDARWLFVVALRLQALFADQPSSTMVRYPADLPSSAVEARPANSSVWGEAPPCPNGHDNVVGVRTKYGHAWQCGACQHLRIRDESSLIGSRDTLVDREQEDPSPVDTGS